MAARTGMDRAAIQKLESGVHTNPTIGTINRYLHALGKRLVVSIVDEAADPRSPLVRNLVNFRRAGHVVQRVTETPSRSQ